MMTPAIDPPITLLVGRSPGFLFTRNGAPGALTTAAMGRLMFFTMWDFPAASKPFAENLKN
jgi:hypothetical protein